MYKTTFIVASLVAILQSGVICCEILKRCYLASCVFQFTLQAIAIISKKRVSVLFQSLFYVECIYDLSLKVFTVINSRPTRVFTLQ